MPRALQPACDAALHTLHCTTVSSVVIGSSQKAQFMLGNRKAQTSCRHQNLVLLPIMLHQRSTAQRSAAQHSAAQSHIRAYYLSPALHYHCHQRTRAGGSKAQARQCTLHSRRQQQARPQSRRRSGTGAGDGAVGTARPQRAAAWPPLRWPRQ